MIVWLASYPRSGNTYVRAILMHYFGQRSYSIYGDRFDIARNAVLSELVGHEVGDKTSINLDELRKTRELYFIKTHDLPNGSISEDDTIFYILRDGRDACVSYLNYLHTVAGRTDMTLEDVLMGSVAFGSWGNHVIQWHQVQSDKLHTFRFEDITVDPEAFAEKLSTLLDSERSHEPFPDFETFRESAPSFFGTGTSGGYAELFSGIHCALFELCSGPAMHVAGYEPNGLSDEQFAAYATYCRHLTELARTSDLLKAKHAAMAQEQSRLSSGAGCQRESERETRKGRRIPQREIQPTPEIHRPRCRPLDRRKVSRTQEEQALSHSK